MSAEINVHNPLPRAQPGDVITAEMWNRFVDMWNVLEFIGPGVIKTPRGWSQRD